MEKIAIIGCGGSGKSYLANMLAILHSLPLTHLDGVYYDANWKPLPHEKFAAIQHDLVSAPRWLIDGNNGGTLPIRLAAADTVIFLGCTRDHLPGRDHPTQTEVPRRPAHPRWRLRPAHLELHSLHLGLPQDHASPGPAAARQSTVTPRR